MEYRGKTYTVIQVMGPDCWKWTVQLDKGKDQSGEANTRASAITSAIWVIDKVLASQKANPKPSIE